MWYDDGTRDKDGKGWKLAVASVRIGHEPQRFTTATPRGKDNWVYNLFVKKEIPDDVIKLFEEMGGIKRPIVEWWGATIEENKNNLDPGFYA